jgi:hypothetical protein
MTVTEELSEWEDSKNIGRSFIILLHCIVFVKVATKTEKQVLRLKIFIKSIPSPKKCLFSHILIVFKVTAHARRA